MFRMIKILFLVAALAVVNGDPLPKSARLGDLNKYYLYTLDNPLSGVLIPNDIAEDDETIPLLPDNGNPTVVVVHGHEGDAFSQLNPLVQISFLSRGEPVNIIVVDWSSYSRMSYINAVTAVPSVGDRLGELLILLESQNRTTFNDLHLVGFNLGAHVVGATGRKLNGQAARITGLDPSKNQWGANSNRLRRTDAVYVEIIHTDGSGGQANGIGEAIGDVDFFVNAGRSQPGCSTNICSHNRAYEVFAASINRPTRLYGNLCENMSQVTSNRCRGFQLHVGGHETLKLAVPGLYRVNTGTTYPF